nr:hypothetical protein [uncultured Flavobacterium sp.]
MTKQIKQTAFGVKQITQSTPPWVKALMTVFVVSLTVASQFINGNPHLTDAQENDYMFYINQAIAAVFLIGQLAGIKRNDINE